MKFGKIIIATLVIWALHLVWSLLADSWLFAWVYSLPPAFIWKTYLPHVLIGLGGLISVFFLVLFYAAIKESLPGKGVIKGVWFGLFIWLVGSLPAISSFGLTTVISDTVISYWLVNTILLSLWQGLLIAVIYR